MTQALFQSRFAAIVALIVSAFVSVGCSTPPVTGTRASASFDDCVEVRTPYGLQYDCYTVQSHTYQVPTYTQYTQKNPRYIASGKTVIDTQEAYKSYLNSLDEATQADLAEQFSALVTEVQ